MNKPISASSAIACRCRISALGLGGDDAVDHLPEPVRADVEGVGPGPAVHEEGRRSGDPTGFPFLAARLDPAGIAPGRQARVELVAVEADAASEVAEGAARVARLPTPRALGEEQGVRHRPELALLAGALRRQG